MSGRRTLGGCALLGLLIGGVACEHDPGNGDPSGAAGTGSTLSACLERPGQLPRPPAGELPCDLLPPGFTR